MFFETPEMNPLNDLTYDKSNDVTNSGLTVTMTQVNNRYPNDPITYTWVDGATVTALGGSDFALKPQKPTTYTVTAVQTHNFDSKGPITCEATKDITVKVVVKGGDECTPFSAEKAFMPSANSNNVWKLLKSPTGDQSINWYAECSLYIYNSWGQLLYKADKIKDGTGYNSDYVWDGKDSNGDDVPADAYYYLVKCGNCKGKEAIHTGTVSVLRK